MKSNYGEVRPQEITEHIISKICLISLLKEAAQIKLLNYPWTDSPYESVMAKVSSIFNAKRQHKTEGEDMCKLIFWSCDMYFIKSFEN